MDCSVCSAVPFILRPPRNTICAACYEGARSIINLINKLENEKGFDKSSNSFVSPPNSSRGFTNALKWVKEMKDVEEELNEKISFLGGFVAAYRDQIHTDIQIQPGINGPSIPTHRALLAARSEIFKNMLESDRCKAPPNEMITLPELNHEELESLLEFLYSGTLPIEKVEKHVYSLSIAADKYEIPYLQKFCEHWMLGSLNLSNALDVLEISDVCSNQTVERDCLELHC
ncbi:hypothetical protein L1049_012064 [Liquidambar formosana]|uniref:BTB domain-containing protein n=1 Tax=Liquidambar formosana TaxID=63359 RepID=A0AAP0X3Q1_LIQFO